MCLFPIFLLFKFLFCSFRLYWIGLNKSRQCGRRQSTSVNNLISGPFPYIYVAHMFYDFPEVDKVMQGVDYLKQILYEKNLFHVVTLKD